MTTNYQHRYPRIEKLLAVASFLSADGMGFLAFMLSENPHPIPPKGKTHPQPLPKGVGI